MIQTEIERMDFSLKEQFCITRERYRHFNKYFGQGYDQLFGFFIGNIKSNISRSIIPFYYGIIANTLMFFI